MDNPYPIEKRAYPRFQIAIPLSYSMQDTLDLDGHNTINISAQGLFIETDRQLSPGTVLNVCLLMVDDGEKIFRKAKVIWSVLVGQDKYRAGVKIEETNLNAVQLVLRAIKSHWKE